MIKILHLPSGKYLINPSYNSIWPFYDESVAKDSLKLLLKIVNSNNPKYYISKDIIEYGGWNMLPLNPFLCPNMCIEEFDLIYFEINNTIGLVAKK